jgi:2-polyprenyl-3-methyl-5-hydroxy-6-metoxy-1,4-benzoquinol methylase
MSESKMERNDTDREVAAVRGWYDQTADSFNLRYSGTGGEFWQRFEETLALELLGDSAGRILDLGCGPGRLAGSLSSRAAMVLGVDISPAMIRLAKATAHPRNVRYCVMDATRAAVEPSRFDAVISLGMFEYMADPSPFLREILRILKPGGLLLFTSHNRVPFPIRAWLFTESRLRSAIDRVLGKRRGRARDEWFQTVEHQSNEIFSVLKTLGFVGTDYRGFHFPVSVELFSISARIPVKTLANTGKSVAVTIDRALGRWHATRFLCPVSMFTAHKPSTLDGAHDDSRGLSQKG